MRLPALFLAQFLIVLSGLAATAAEPDHQLAAQALRAAVPRVQIAMDAKLGVARHVASADGFLTGPAGVGKAVARAAVAGEDRALRGFLDTWPALFGGGAEILSDAEIIRDDVTAHSGLRTKVWRQMLDGIPVHHGVLVARTTAREELIAVGSGFVPRLSQAAAKIANRAALVAAPKNEVTAAVAAALSSSKLTTTDISTTTTADGATKAQRLRAASANGEIAAQLVWFVGDDGLRLAWSVLLVERPTGLMYTVVVDATSLAVLERIRHTSYGFASAERLAALKNAPMVADAAAKPAARAAAAVGTPTSSAASTIALRVYTSDSPTPKTPGFGAPSSTEPAEVARTLVTLQSIDATASPEGWIDANKETRGNNVDAHLDLNDDDVADTPRPLGTGTSPVTFDFPLDLTQEPSTYRNAAVTNLFYWCNVAHDRLYQLGFTETAGNFQNNNFSRGGAGNDAVQADAQDGSGTNNANFSTPSDGSTPLMQMFIFNVGASPDRDSSLDATVILHEYVHGLSNRLVGGGDAGSVDALQSSGMGEGWSDFYALALLSDPTDDPLGTYTTGGYLMRNHFSGIRRYPYAVEPGNLVTSSSLNPLTFNDIISNTEVHDMGEVWCQALWECRGELLTKHGAAAGNTLMLELVTDGMKLTPANPTFTEARDAIIQADLVATGGANATELWRAFTKRGLGRGASAGSSGTVTGVAESFENSNVFRVSNAAGLRAQSPNGALPQPSSADFVLSNPGTASLNWTASKSRTWSTLSASAGTLAAGASTTVTCTLTNDASTLTDGTWLDTITFTDTTHGLTVVRPIRVIKAPNYVLSSTGFSWIDPAGHTALSLTDDSSLSQTLPFSFPFYGTSTTAMFVSSNGVIGFASSTGLGTPYNQSLPESGNPNNLAAGMWMDLNPVQGGSVRYGEEGSAPNRKAVITWNGVPPFNVPSLPMTFQIVLEEATGNLVMQYQQVQAGNTTFGAGRIASVGVENSTGTVAVQHSYAGSSLLANGQALRYVWTGANPSPTNATPTVVPPGVILGALNPAGTTRTVTVLGADADGGGEMNLMYTWSLAGSPTSIFTFAANGNNAAKSSVVTFTKAGTFPIRATITDAAGASATSTVNATVPQQLTSLGVSPATTAIANGTTVDFTALGFDQFGDGITGEPTVTWSKLSGPGSINSTGLYTASGQGAVTIQAASGALTPATATITVTNGAPTVATPAAASPGTVTGTTTTLSVTGADDGGEPALTYTWSTTGTPPAAVTFSANGSNAAKSSVATFSKAGTYVLRATISDASAATVTSDITVTVQQTNSAPAVAINPGTATIAPGTTQVFTAHNADQFGDPIIAIIRSVTWSAVGGTIATDGTFTAPASTGTATITATAVGGGQTDSATVTIAAGGGSGGDGGGGGGGGCGLGATSTLTFLLLMLTWRRRRLGE